MSFPRFVLTCRFNKQQVTNRSSVLGQQFNCLLLFPNRSTHGIRQFCQPVIFPAPKITAHGRNVVKCSAMAQRRRQIRLLPEVQFKRAFQNKVIGSLAFKACDDNLQSSVLLYSSKQQDQPADNLGMFQSIHVGDSL